MTGDKCITIIAGTEDIHRPLFQSLRACIKNPVHLIMSGNQENLCKSLSELLEKSEVWVFPSNEITLNILHSLVRDRKINYVERLIIPGTSQTDKRLSSAELSNKGTLYSSLQDMEFLSFRKLETIVVSGNDLQALSTTGTLSLPVIIKPAEKDEADIFTRNFPAKIILIETAKDLLIAANILKKFGTDRMFIIQEVQQGLNISWYGYACSGHSYGYCIVPIVKSPSDSIGGTTTLAFIEEPDSHLTGAADELVRALKLDGIFEIEFIRHDGHLYFPFEINPRPALQIALVLQQKRNIFTEYLKEKGFAFVGGKSSERCRTHWGSAWRYMELNKGENISLPILLKTAVHDVRYMDCFSYSEKIFYTLSLIKSFIRKKYTG
jgi:hypothetical protein